MAAVLGNPKLKESLMAGDILDQDKLEEMIDFEKIDAKPKYHRKARPIS